jgi:hypothetical protein
MKLDLHPTHRKLDLHHRIYIVLLTCLLGLGCVAGWYFVANEREAILTQQEARKDLRTLVDPKTGLQTAVLARVDTATGVIDRQLTNALGKADGQLTNALGKADKQITAGLAEVHLLNLNADKRSGELLKIAAGVRGDLKPSLDNTAALVKDAQDSLDDSYFDIKATIESATVTTHSIALASEAIANAAPSVSASVVGIGKSADGITADVHTATAEFVKPKTVLQQIQSWLLTIARIYGAI